MSEKPDLSAEVLLPTGKMIDKYQIVKLIGLGGMGAVYLAIDTDSEYDNAYVALKILYPTLARKSGDFTRRFLREARIASRIRHPNLVQVFECNFCDEEGFYFLAQEYVGGGSLRQLVANDTVLSEVEALRVAIGVAQALGAVHEHKVVHRDIKPDNIMFADDGTVKLTDWGIAKQKTFSNAAALAQLELTVNKVFIGTPLYASPEQIQDSRNVDIRSDIYSLGATIYYSLVGKPPFRGTTEVDSLCAVLTKPAPDVRKARPDISDKLAVLLLRMLAKSPGERPANPGILLELFFDAGQKYHLKAHLGESGIHVSLDARPSLKDGAEQAPVAAALYQPTEATRRPESERPAPVEKLKSSAGSRPESKQEAFPAVNPASASGPVMAPQQVDQAGHFPAAVSADDSFGDFSSETARTLIGEKPVVEPFEGPGTRQGRNQYSLGTGRENGAELSRTIPGEGVTEESPPGQAQSMTVAVMIWLILFFSAIFFASEQWVELKRPGKRFEQCMKMGEAALQNHSWQTAMFYFRGASDVTSFENDRRPYQAIDKAKRGLDFKQKTAVALQVLHQEVDKSKVDWKAAHELFSAALAIEGFEQNPFVLKMEEYCSKGIKYATLFSAGHQAAENKQWQSAAEQFAAALRVRGFDQEPEACKFLQEAKNYLLFQEQLEIGKKLSAGAGRSGIVDDWKNAVDAFHAAMSISGISEQDRAASGKALQDAEGAFLQAQRKYMEQLFQQVRAALKKEDHTAALNQLGSIRQSSFTNKDDLQIADELEAEIGGAQNAAAKKNLLAAGEAAFGRKDYIQAEKVFLEGLTIPGYQEDSEVMEWLKKVRSAHFDLLLEEAGNPGTSVDLAKKKLLEAERIPGILDAERHRVEKIRSELVKTEEKRRNAENQRNYDFLLDQAVALLGSAETLAVYDRVEKLYLEAAQLGVSGSSEANAGLQKCRQQRIVFLFKEGDGFVARKNWLEALGCFQKILSCVSADSGDRKEAEEKIADCFLRELSILLDQGKEALQREDWQVAEDAYRQAVKVAAPGRETPDKLLAILEGVEFSMAKTQAQEGLRSARNGLDFQRHLMEGKSLLNQKKFRQAVSAFDQALKIPGFEKHSAALKNRGDAVEGADEEKKEVDRIRFTELMDQAGRLLMDGSFTAAEEKYNAAGKVPGYAQDQRVIGGLDKCRNGLRFQQLKNDLDGAMQREDWHSAEKFLLDVLLLPGYQTDQDLLIQLKTVRGRIFQTYAARGEKLFGEEQWERASAEFQNALAVEGYNAHRELQGFLSQSQEMLKWLVRIRVAEIDFRKVLARLRGEKYFRTGAMKQDYIIELKNIWTEARGCPVESIREGRLEDVWGDEILPSLSQVAEALLYHTQVLSLTDELQARARRDFLALLAEVDEICQGRIGSLGEKTELRINVTRFFLVDYFHPMLVKNPNDLSEDPRRISWLAKLFR